MWFISDREPLLADLIAFRGCLLWFRFLSLCLCSRSCCDGVEHFVFNAGKCRMPVIVVWRGWDGLYCGTASAVAVIEKINTIRTPNRKKRGVMVRGVFIKNVSCLDLFFSPVPFKWPILSQYIAHFANNNNYYFWGVWRQAGRGGYEVMVSTTRHSVSKAEATARTYWMSYINVVALLWPPECILATVTHTKQAIFVCAISYWWKFLFCAEVI